MARVGGQLIIWYLGASIVLNVLLLYAWIHDVAIYKRSSEGYEKKYYDTLDFHYGNPKGTTSWRLVEGYPEGSGMRKEEEARHRRMYGDDVERRAS